MGKMNVDESRYRPTREAVFTETMQIGIVVRDLDAALRRYVDDYGIGPWQVHEFDPEDAKDLHEYGQPVGRSGRGAVTRFLAEKGEGVHHIAVATPRFDETVTAEAERGRELVLSLEFSGVKIAYLDTRHDLGVTIEVFDQMPGDGRDPDAT
jgi:methylmalonyl-CoA/ethylmalonyl-CoA epimerase